MNFQRNKLEIALGLLLCFSLGMKIERKTTKYSPILFFKENSLKYDTLYNYFENGEKLNDTTETLLFITKLWKKDTLCTVEIGGHSDKLEDKVYGKLRAQKVYSFLYEHGISKVKMKMKSYENTQPYISEAVIKSTKNDFEKKTLRRFNRRVTFKFGKN